MFEANGEKGNITTEFLVVFPAFMFLILFTIEVAFLWSDRHVAYLSAFEAGRAYLLSEESNPCEDRKAKKAAKKRAMIKMASVAPDIGTLGRSIGIDPPGLSYEADGYLSRALMHLVTRIPMAFAQTHVECSYDPTRDQIEVEVSYYRAAKMPYVKHALWAAYMIHRMGSSDAGDSLDLDLGDQFLGIKVNSKRMGHLNQTVASVREKLDEYIRIIRNLDMSMAEGAELVTGIFGEEYLDELKVIRFGDKIQQEIDKNKERKLDSRFSEINDELSSHAKIASAIIYAVPDELRLIPIRRKIKISRLSYKNKSKRNWEGGQAIFIAPLNTNEPFKSWVDGMLQSDEYLR